MKASSMVYRKILTCFLTAIAFTLGTTLVFIYAFDAYESLGGGVIGISLVIAFYTVPVMVLYGIPVSLLIEYTFSKKGFSSDIVYIVIHSIFGAASYFMFWEWGGVIYGVIAGCLFASIDRILSRFQMTDKFIVATIVIPIGIYALLTIVIAAIG